MTADHVLVPADLMRRVVTEEASDPRVMSRRSLVELIEFAARAGIEGHGGLPSMPSTGYRCLSCGTASPDGSEHAPGCKQPERDAEASRVRWNEQLASYLPGGKNEGARYQKLDIRADAPLPPGGRQWPPADHPWSSGRGVLDGNHLLAVAHAAAAQARPTLEADAARAGKQWSPGSLPIGSEPPSAFARTVQREAEAWAAKLDRDDAVLASGLYPTGDGGKVEGLPSGAALREIRGNEWHREQVTRAGLVQAIVDAAQPVTDDGEPKGLPALGRVANIAGNLITVRPVFGAIRKGMRLVSDDDRHGRAPRSGCATIEGIGLVDTDGLLMTVDNACALNTIVNDYLFEMPPTPDEKRAADFERRLAAMEAAEAKRTEGYAAAWERLGKLESRAMAVDAEGVNDDAYGASLASLRAHIGTLEGVQGIHDADIKRIEAALTTATAPRAEAISPAEAAVRIRAAIIEAIGRRDHVAALNLSAALTAVQAGIPREAPTGSGASIDDWSNAIVRSNRLAIEQRNEAEAERDTWKTRAEGLAYEAWQFAKAFWKLSDEVRTATTPGGAVLLRVVTALLDGARLWMDADVNGWKWK